MAFPFLTIFLLFIAWFTYNKARIEKLDKARQDEFWQKEEEANSIRRKDISLLPYIRIPMESLPFGKCPEDAQLLDCEERIRALAQLRILNLTGKTNTELKLAYGAPNLNLLIEYDQNFTVLVRTMQQWGSRLYELSFIDAAQCVLSYAVKWGSDIKGSYLLLARIYLETGDTSALHQLKEQAGKLSSLRKENILSALKELS